MKTYQVGESGVNVRLDNYLTEIVGTSRAFVQKLIDKDLITVNDKTVKHGHKLRENDLIEVKYSFTKKEVLPTLDLKVLYEDDNCVVIDKPSGLLVHSKGAFNPEPTVASWLAEKYHGEPGDRAGIVHRLDRGTSGVMICAKNAETHSFLQKQFAQRKVKKKYLAIIVGTLEPKEAVIDMPIERNPKVPSTFRVGSNGKTAQTHYLITKEGDTYSQVLLSPVTGRTHQLRVHLAKFNHPILGDIFYKGKKADRLYLHAMSLEITIPGGIRKVFESEPPKIFNDIILKK